MSAVDFYDRRWLLLYVPTMLLCAAALVLVTRLWFPLPPDHVIFIGGAPNSSHGELSRRYVDVLEDMGISGEVVHTERDPRTTVERLADAPQANQVGFSHGLSPVPKGGDALAKAQALAVVGKQVVWVFGRAGRVGELAQLRGARIAAGGPSAASRRVAVMLLDHANVPAQDVTWVEGNQPLQMARLLAKGDIDALVLIGTVDAPAVKLMLRTPQVRVLSVPGVQALLQREPKLHALVIPQGAMDMNQRLPAQDITALYVQTHLMVRRDMHPALQRALMDAATQVHDEVNLVQTSAEFPQFSSADYPLSPYAQRYTKQRRPWIESVLPYGQAQRVRWVVLALLPTLALLGFLLTRYRTLFSWHVNALLQRYYGELKFLETELPAIAADRPIQLRRRMAALDELDRRVGKLKLPAEFTDRWYTLRMHLADVRARMMDMRAQ